MLFNDIPLNKHATRKENFGILLTQFHFQIKRTEEFQWNRQGC